MPGLGILKSKIVYTSTCKWSLKDIGLTPDSVWVLGTGVKIRSIIDWVQVVILWCQL